MSSIGKQFISIEQEGLQTYLERTAAEHNGFGYDEFIKRYSVLHEPKTIIANAFGVSSNTIYRWLEVFNKEGKT